MKVKLIEIVAAAESEWITYSKSGIGLGRRTTRVLSTGLVPLFSTCTDCNILCSQIPTLCSRNSSVVGWKLAPIF